VWGKALLHIFPSSITEHLRCSWGGSDASSCCHHLACCAGGVASVLPEALQASWHHLLKTNNQDTIGAAMADDIPCEMQTSRASRTVVVNIVDWDLGHSELVEYSLSARRVAVAIACDALVNVVVTDLRIKHSLDTSFEAELGVVNLASWFDEFGHAYAEDVAWFVAFDDHYERG